MICRLLVTIMMLMTGSCLPQTGKRPFNLTEGPTSMCHHKFSFMSSRKGTFMSPQFPEKYQNELECVYFFQAAEHGRIKITFDLFNLEAPNSDKGCQFDYIEIFNIDAEGFKVLMDRYCGDRAPKEFISKQSKLEIVFKTDFTKELHGFIGHYEFLDESNSNWHHFGMSTVGCGAGFHTGKSGVITSPGYPGHPSIPVSRCTWIINVQKYETILITVQDLEFSSYCSDSFLMFFNGFTVPGAYPDERFCGQYALQPQELEFISEGPRLIIRYESKLGVDEAKFKLVWTAAMKVDNGKCDQHLCQQHRECISTKLNTCQTGATYQLCIDQSLMCDGNKNCGSSDVTDENYCGDGFGGRFNSLVYIIIYIGVPVSSVLLILVIVITACMCYRSKRRKQNVIKMESQKAKQTHWVSPHIRSSDPSSMAAQSATLLTTSFVSDKNPNDIDETIDRRRKIQNRTIENIKSSEMFNRRKEKDKPSLDSERGEHQLVADSDDEHHDIVTHSIHLEPQVVGTTSSFKSHKKRSSYHMMQELTLDNSDTQSQSF